MIDNTTAQTPYRFLMLVTAAVGAAVFFWGLGDIALMSFNEARRAIPISEMFSGGSWLLPHLNGELYLTKPPLLYWLATPFAYLLGTANEWAVRLPSAVAAGILVIACYRYAMRAFGPWPALFTAQLLIANASFAMFARRAEIEMLLTALCAGALMAALRYTREQGGRGWLRLSYFLLGLAVLTKGPLALLFVTLPLLVDAAVQRGPRRWAALSDPVGWAIFLLVGLSWYVAVTVQLGMDAWMAIIHRDMLNKMEGAAGEPVYSYVLWLLADFFPAGLLLLVRPVTTWKRWKGQQECLSLLIAVAVPLLVYSLFSNKHAKYLLPIYPFLAILLGKRLGEILEGAGPMLRRALLAAGIALPLAYAAFYTVAEARLFSYRIEAFPQFSAWLKQVPGVPLYGYRDLDERLIYYAQRHIPMLDATALQQLKAGGKPALLLVENAHVAEVRPQADCLVRTFRPYLKKNRELAVFGWGAACQGVPASPER